MAQRTSWEHKDIASNRQRNILHGLQTPCEVEIEKYLGEDEHAELENKTNLAAQILDRQSQHLARLRRRYAQRREGPGKIATLFRSAVLKSRNGSEGYSSRPLAPTMLYWHLQNACSNNIFPHIFLPSYFCSTI